MNVGPRTEHTTNTNWGCVKGSLKVTDFYTANHLRRSSSVQLLITNDPSAEESKPIDTV